MLRFSRVFKNYNETGSLSEQINLYGFIGPHVFLTREIWPCEILDAVMLTIYPLSSLIGSAW